MQQQDGRAEGEVLQLDVPVASAGVGQDQGCDDGREQQAATDSLGSQRVGEQA